MTADFPLFIPTWRAGAIWGQRLRLEPTCQPHTRFNNICRPPRKIFVKHLLREMHLCWLNFLTWYQINFSFVSNCSWQYCSGFSRFFFSQRQKVIISWTMEWQNVDQQIQLKTIFLQVQVLHWCEHWPICQSRRTASVTNTLSNLRQIRKKCYVGHWPICQSDKYILQFETNTFSHLRQICKKCYVGHWPICQSRQHLAAWALLLSSPSPMFTHYRDCPSHIWLLLYHLLTHILISVHQSFVKVKRTSSMFTRYRDPPPPPPPFWAFELAMLPIFLRVTFAIKPKY